MGETRVGHGILSWNSTERRSDRYGAFVLGQCNFEDNVRVAAHLDEPALRGLIGKRVRVLCKVVANRGSGHLGDTHHGIKPTTPEVGEVVDLGVGTLRLVDAGFGGMTAVALEPNDGRKHFWYDPYKLYRLHDQTVDLFIEETSDEFSPAPTLKAHEGGPEQIETGTGYAQVKGVEEGVEYFVPADVERLGGGMFVLSHPTGMEAGRRRKMERR